MGWLAAACIPDSVRVTLFSATGEIIGLGAQIPTLTPSVLRL